MAFGAQEWREIAEVYVGSLEYMRTNAKALSQPFQDRINSFILNFILAEKPFMLATQQGVAHAVETVFSDEIIRDFVLGLTFVFFSRWGGTSERYNDLVETLAFAVSANTSVPLSGNSRVTPSAIPPQVLDDLPNEAAVLPVLQGNKWLVVLLLAHLSVEVPPVPESKTPKKQQQQPQ